MNRHITDAVELFGEIEDSDAFFSLPSNERFNLPHQPISSINILAASPLHSYTCVFSWFNLLIYHLHSGCLEWSPTSAAIQSSLISVRTVIQKKTSMKAEQPDPRGGTTSTGSVPRKAFSDESNYRYCVSTVMEEDRESISLLHIYLSAILRVVSSGRIDTNRLGHICTDAYLLVLDTFPWLSILLHFINY